MDCLEIQGIIHYSNNKNILSDIYLICNTSEIISVVGLNGSGKTTLFKILSGITKNNNSFMYINKKRCFNPKKYIKYCPANNILPYQYKLTDIISFLYKKDIQIKLYENDIIKENENKKISELSQGTIKYIQIILYLYMDNPFIILDEPFLGLSPIMSEKLSTYIIEAKKNKGIILTDHNYYYLNPITDKFYTLNNGILKPNNLII